MRLYPVILILSIIKVISTLEVTLTSYPANYVGPGIRNVYCKLESYHKFEVSRPREKACQRLAYKNSWFKWPIFQFFQYPKVYNPPPADRFTIPGSPYYLFPFELKPGHKKGKKCFFLATYPL